MTVADTMTGQTRFERAKDIIGDTVNRLSAANTGLDAFSLIVKVIVPPTLDHLYLRMLLRDVQINETGLAGTDFRRVFNELQRSLWSNLTDKYITLVVVSDGGDTHLEGQPDDKRAAYIREILSELGNVDASHRRIFTVGVGSTEGQTIPGVEYQGNPVMSALVPDVLQQIADKGHGAYFQANRFDGMGLSEDLAAAIIEGAPPPLQAGEGHGTIRTGGAEAPPPIPLFFLPLLLAIGMLVAALALPEVDPDAADPTAKRMVS
jgi:Ca-activated chloride channel family protein